MNLLFRLLKFFIPKSYITKLKVRYNVPDMFWSLENLYKNGFRPTKIIDVGAFEGEWTKEVSSIFDEASFLMIEAQSSKEDKLKLMKSNKIDYRISLLGPLSGQKAKFYINETVSSALPESEKENQEYVEIPMYTLDEILAEKLFTNADFLKLDVQGYELEVLKGASNVLRNVEVVLMEVSLIEINNGAPLIKDVINFMDERGFVCYDICSMIRRPLDRALWQTDLIFVKKNSKLVASKKYS